MKGEGTVERPSPKELYEKHVKYVESNESTGVFFVYIINFVLNLFQFVYFIGISALEY